MYDDVDTLMRQIAHLEGIIRDNKLHESYCPAFSTAKGDFANMFSGLLEGECHCWIAPDAFPGESSKAIGIYDRASETVVQGRFFRDRHAARNHILKENALLSADPHSERYWGNTYLVVPVTLTLADPERPIA